MDLLNRAYSQLSDLYRSLTPASRATAGVLALVVALSAGYLFTHEGSSPEVDLMHGVSIGVGQLPLMEAAFAKANLKGHEVRGASVFVPRGQEPAYMAALADAKALPPNFGDALREAINAGNPFENSRQREQRTKIGTQDTLSLIISKMPGIETAYVLYDVDSRPGGFRDKLITATACVKPASTNQLDEARVVSIRHLIAGAIAGLKPENVTVSDLNGRTWYASAEGHDASESDRYISLRKAYEQDLKAKILNALCYIPNVTVATTVELAQPAAPAAQKKHTAHNPKDRQTPANSATSLATSNTQQANTAAVLKTLFGASRSDETPPATDDAASAASEPAERQVAAMTPVSARASVGVPASYFRKVWQERNTDASGRAAKTPDPAALEQVRAEVSATIQRHVGQLLPANDNAAKATDSVIVTTFQDIAVQEPTLPAPPAPGREVLEWLRQSWRMVGATALAIVGLLVLWSMVRARPAVAATRKSLDVDLHDDASDAMPPTVPSPHARRFRQSRSPLREELSELVEGNPDAAANVLRNWIGHPG
jgi:flagellar M-ring protein FliF